MATKIECQYCGKEFSEKGIKMHERSCSEKPEENEVTLDTGVEENDDIKIVKDYAKQEPAKPKKVKIKMKKNHRCNIGGNWYVFKADKQYDVPVDVKEILSKRDLIKAL